MMYLVPSMPATSKILSFPFESRIMDAHAIRDSVSMSSDIAVDARTCFVNDCIKVGDLPVSK